MSKDIWHFPSEAPAYCFQCVFYDMASNEYHFGQYSPVFKHFRSENTGWEHEEVQRFAFAEDIIACLDLLERTRKALEIAKWWLNEIVENYRCTPISTAEMALKEITEMEQKD